MACTRLRISFFFGGFCWNGHTTNGVNFRTPLSGARGIRHDVSHLNTGGGCGGELFACSLPSWSCNRVRQSRHKKFSIWMGYVCECVGGQMFFWRRCFGFTIPRQRIGQLHIVGGQPVSTCYRKHCVLYIKVISRQLLTCVGFCIFDSWSYGAYTRHKSIRRTTWIHLKIWGWRAPACSPCVSLQSDSARNTRLVRKFGCFQSFWMPLAVCIGLLFDMPCVLRAFRITWGGCCRNCTRANQDKFVASRDPAKIFPYLLAWNKDVSEVVVYFPQCCSGPCKVGGATLFWKDLT